MRHIKPLFVSMPSLPPSPPFSKYAVFFSLLTFTRMLQFLQKSSMEGMSLLFQLSFTIMIGPPLSAKLPLCFPPCRWLMFQPFHHFIMRPSSPKRLQGFPCSVRDKRPSLLSNPLRTFCLFTTERDFLGIIQS